MSHNVALKFSAHWCETCRANAPAVEAVFAQRPDITLQTVDIDRDPLLAFQHNVRTIPAILLFKDGVVVGRVDGAITPDTFLEQLDMLYGTLPL